MSSRKKPSTLSSSAQVSTEVIVPKIIDRATLVGMHAREICMEHCVAGAKTQKTQEHARYSLTQQRLQIEEFCFRASMRDYAGYLR